MVSSSRRRTTHPTAAVSNTTTTVSICAVLNDHNTTSYGGTSPGFNLGTGGPVNSNIVIATIAITVPTSPLTPAIPPILTPPLQPDGDNPIEHFGFGSGNRNIIVDRPGRPENWLIGSDVRRFVIANQHAVEPLPPDMFYDTDPSAILTLEAKLSNGRPLPDWLIFDARGRVFYGTPPASFHGAVDIRIDATDDFDHHATGEYRILVGRDLKELEKLLAPPTANPPLPSLAFGERVSPSYQVAAASAPVARIDVGDSGQAASSIAIVRSVTSIDPAHDRSVNEVDKTAITAFIKTATSRNLLNRPDFAQQLRDAGRMGRLGQARSLLRSLNAEAEKRPAA